MTGFNIVLTIANNASGKTATVTVPFKGQTDPNSESPQFKVNGDSYTQPRFFVTRASNKDADKDTATEFTDLNGKKVTFTAVENADSKQNVKITGNGANFKTPGQYTVTLTATNTKGKTSQAVYTLVVLGESSQHVYANGAPNVATYSLEGGQAKKLDTTLKDNQPVTVEGVAKTVNGVSYTQVKTDDGKEYYVQTANLTKKETNSGTKDQQTVRNYKLMHALTFIILKVNALDNQFCLLTFNLLLTVTQLKLAMVSTTRLEKTNTSSRVTSLAVIEPLLRMLIFTSVMVKHILTRLPLSVMAKRFV